MNDADIAAIRPGDHVKVMGRTWVEVTAIDGNRFTGTLDSIPGTLPLAYGQTFEFTAARITAIMPASDDKTGHAT